MSSNAEGTQATEPALVVTRYSDLNGSGKPEFHIPPEVLARILDKNNMPEAAAVVRGVEYEPTFINKVKAWGKSSPSVVEGAVIVGSVLGGAVLGTEAVKLGMHFAGNDTDFRLFGIGMKWKTRAMANKGNVRPIRSQVAGT